MLSNLRRGLFPTYGAPGPSFISEVDLRALYTAFKRTGKWAPNNEDSNDKTRVGDNYGDWVRAAFGQGLHPDVEIDPAYVLDLDGFMNTYRDVLRDMGHFINYSLNNDLQGDLFDPKTNELLAVSTSPIVRQQLKEQVILPKLNLDFGDLNRGVGLPDTVAGRLASSGFRAHSRRRVAAWRRANKVRPEKRISNVQFVQYGAQVLENNGETHSLTRILLALRHGTTMLNPGLYISMIPEQGFRMYLNGMANALTGQSTSRGVGGLASRMRINQYDPEMIKSLNDLYDSMSNDSSFAGLIIKDLMYQQPQGDTGAGKIVRGAERFAAVGNKWQDPTWGIRQRAMARTYVEAVIRSINAMPISNAISIEQLIARLRTDPAWVANNHPELHQMASNSVVDLRGLKHTPASLAIKALYEPLTRSSSATLQFAGTLLKLPLMYANFNMNMLTTLTGMQGYSQIVATFLDGRRTPGTMMHRMWKAKNDQELTPEDDIRYDMSSTMDGYTIANAFIRGGVTQTGLFMIGMLTGGILSGEDEEARRRRKLAEAQNAPYVADPRRLEADFRNKDMIFTDWLPPQLSSFFTVAMEDESQEMRSGFQMSWLMKPFLSPILGIERFLQTGDFGWVTYGFLDGVGSMPLFNKTIWDDAVRSVDELTALAAEQQELGTPDSTRNTMYLLTSAVAVYERMLLENMFVNSLYSGFDTYDRDPTKLPLLDSDGQMQVTIEGNPRPNDLALQTFVNKDGEVQQGYLNRDALERNLAYYTENNATAAAILSLVTGFQRGLSRYSMPVKMQELELPLITEGESKLLVSEVLRQAWSQNGGAPRHMSLEEITKQISSAAASAKNWDVYNQADVLAAAAYESDANPVFDPLSTLDVDGNEVLTTPGAVAVLTGIRNGSVTLGSPSLKGISIPFEMREQIQADFLNDVTQQGVDMGMTNTQAVSRAKRLFYGPLDNPDIVGFSDILWSDQIAYSNKRQYKQLNTTYVRGPDGYPWATGFKRGGVLAQLGLPARANLGPPGGTTTDGRMNTVDLVAGINTGMRGLVPFDSTENIPTDKEIGDSIVKAIEALDLQANDFEPFDKKNSSGSFYRGGGYSRYPRSSGGYSSGGGYMPTIYFSRMPRLPDGTNIYGNSTKNIFWDNVTLKRTRIRRERVQSSRGRLKQWQ
jgi:hypothetical protein